MTFSNTKQHIPECFQEKIDIDREIDDMRRQKIVDFKRSKSLVLRQLNARYACEAHIKTQRGGTAG